MNEEIPAGARPAETGAADTADEALFDILIAPDPMLRRKARPVRPADAASLRPVVPRMLRTMYAAPGIGLAAPQIGLDLRLAVVDLAEAGARSPLILLNPEVVAESDAMAAREEGCLSLPGQYADVVRPQAVRVRYQTFEGAWKEVEADGLLATCLQHEIDHLDGVLFVDHISSLKRNMIMRRLLKDQKGKGSAKSRGGSAS